MLMSLSFERPATLGLWISKPCSNYSYLRGGVVARLTRNVEVVGSSLIKGPHCFLEQETLPLLLSIGWF